ncbi:MAG: alanine--glyoxylate aminotransferase family protein [Epsilonproteobacteria bacterium]|nr:alanine--glyoxylate aminotransferase family protein [Campylobacterota bacterium]
MLLFTPGPTPVPEEVRVAMAAPTIHHRTPEFEKIFSLAREGLFRLFRMDEAVVLASSGTGAMEASILNVAKKKVLTINAGKFGERFSKIVKAFNFDLKELKYEWNEPAKVEDVIQAIKSDRDIDTIAIQVCESAGGLRHPVEDIAKAVKEIDKDIAIVADGITAVGVEEIDTSNIDVLIAGSQKALMLPPGLAMIGLSNYAIDRIGDGRGYYFNLKSEISKQRKNTTAYTAATTLIIGLNKIFELIEKEGGLKELYKKTYARGVATREALEEIGYKIYPKAPALAMSAIEDLQSEEIRGILKKEFRVNVAGGQDHLKGKIFRINNMGLIENQDIEWVINSLELIASRLKGIKYKARGVEVFNQKFLELYG